MCLFFFGEFKTGQSKVTEGSPACVVYCSNVAADPRDMYSFPAREARFLDGNCQRRTVRLRSGLIQHRLMGARRSVQELKAELWLAESKLTVVLFGLLLVLNHAVRSKSHYGHFLEQNHSENTEMTLQTKTNFS